MKIWSKKYLLLLTVFLGFSFFLFNLPEVRAYEFGALSGQEVTSKIKGLLANFLGRIIPEAGAEEPSDRECEKWCVINLNEDSPVIIVPVSDKNTGVAYLKLANGKIVTAIEGANEIFAPACVKVKGDPLLFRLATVEYDDETGHSDAYYLSVEYNKELDMHIPFLNNVNFESTDKQLVNDGSILPNETSKIRGKFSRNPVRFGLNFMGMSGRRTMDSELMLNGFTLPYPEVGSEPSVRPKYSSIVINTVMPGSDPEAILSKEKATLAHEIGHAFGLSHLLGTKDDPENANNLMGAYPGADGEEYGYAIAGKDLSKSQIDQIKKVCEESLPIDDPHWEQNPNFGKGGAGGETERSTGGGGGGSTEKACEIDFDASTKKNLVCKGTKCPDGEVCNVKTCQCVEQPKTQPPGGGGVGGGGSGKVGE